MRASSGPHPTFVLDLGGIVEDDGVHDHRKDVRPDLCVDVAGWEQDEHVFHRAVEAVGAAWEGCRPRSRGPDATEV